MIPIFSRSILLTLAIMMGSAPADARQQAPPSFGFALDNQSDSPFTFYLGSQKAGLFSPSNRNVLQSGKNEFISCGARVCLVGYTAFGKTRITRVVTGNRYSFALINGNWRLYSRD